MHPIMIPAFLLAALCLCTIFTQAQNFAEWWQQKRARIQYLQQQATALTALKKTVEKGYQIAKDGIQDIRDIKEGDFDLHTSYFHSMEVANPVVVNSHELSVCFFRLRSLLNLISAKLQTYSKDSRIKPADQIFYMGIFNYYLADAQENIQRVHALVTDFQLKMTDGERLLDLLAIEDETLSQIQLVHFCSEIIEARIRDGKSESDDINQTLHLYQ